MSKEKDIGEHCIECGRSVAAGSGLYVNRIPADNGDLIGFLCADCQAETCDLCGEPGIDLTCVEETVEETDKNGKSVKQYNPLHVCDDCLESTVIGNSKYRNLN